MGLKAVKQESSSWVTARDILHIILSSTFLNASIHKKHGYVITIF